MPRAPPRATPPLGRRLAWALLATALGLTLIEGSAGLAERTVLSQERTLPEPGPTRDKGLEARLQAERAARGLEIPLVADDAAGWGLEPGQVSTHGEIVVRVNAMGMRGPELTPKAPGERRLLTVGDSSIFGFGVPEAGVFSSVAAAELARSGGHPVTAWIGAVPGHGADQAKGVLQRVGQAVGPDWVVIGSLWSDLYGRDAHLPGVEETRGHLRTFATYRVTRQLLAPVLRPARVRWLTGAQDLGDPQGARKPRTDLLTYASHLRQMGAMATRLGARPVYLVLPAPMDFDRAPVPEIVAEYRLAMCQVAAEQQAPCIDGPALFQQAGADPAWFLDQVHPAAVGHDLLGRALADTLREQGATAK